MSELVSPGISIPLSDESAYPSSGAGTVPLIVIATEQDKTAPDGITTAAYTTAAEAGRVKLITSQRDLLLNYGNPVFKTFSGTALHGHELNEYGLLAAHSFLGISNRAYVLRADIDLSAIEGSTTAPAADPADGTYWLSSAATSWGVKRWDGTRWVSQTVRIPEYVNIGPGDVPLNSYGLEGDFAMVYFDSAGDTIGEFKLCQKVVSSNVSVTPQWYEVGTQEWQEFMSPGAEREFMKGTHLQIPSSTRPAANGGGALLTGDVFLQTTPLNNGSVISLKVYDDVLGQWVNPLSGYSSGLGYTAATSRERYTAFTTYNPGQTIAAGELWFDTTAMTFRIHNGNSTTTATSSAFTNVSVVAGITTSNTNVAFNVNINDGVDIPVYLDVDNTGNADSHGANVSLASIAQCFNNAFGDALANTSTNYSTGTTASVSGSRLVITNSRGYDILITAGTIPGLTPSDINLVADVPYSNWSALDFTIDDDTPVGTITDGTLWYQLLSSTAIDILKLDEANGWVDYTDGNITLAASAPTARAVDDLWIDTSDLENFPVIYRYSSANTWVQVDNTDQVSSDGIVFADFRSEPGAAIDADAPSTLLYPANILGWNKRYSAGNVKRWVVDHEFDGTVIGDRWVDFSGNSSTGAPLMLRKAQRSVVVGALQAAIAGNDDIRNEINRFNLIACPGYTELFDEMLTLQVDRKETAFIVVDPPLRLSAASTATQAWATNSNNASENGEDGLVSSSQYAAVYYPHGLTTNVTGGSVVVPSSHMALRTIAYNDQVAFPWLAPAGFPRGVITNATGLGYVDAVTGEFVSVALSEGQRDSLYLNRINPIGNFPGRGLAVYGQKTLSPTETAMDRVNVARLVVYIRERLDDIMRPFLFLPNDDITRQDAKVVVDRFLGQLVTTRGLFDFLTVCDSSNNTQARVTRKELWMDIAIQPVPDVEFIYIPIRIQNTLGAG